MEREDWGALLAQIEGLFREGQLPQGAEVLRALNTAKVPRELRRPLAQLTRKLGVSDVGFRLLAPIVRPQGNLAEKASAHELVEYAGLLHSIGSIDEALAILKDVSVQLVPEAALYSAYCEMNKWNSSEAAEHLKIYLQQEISDELRLTAKINLASAMTGIPENEAALKLSRECILEAAAAGNTRIAAHSHIVCANVFLSTQDAVKARAELAEASLVLNKGRFGERTYLEQRYAYIEALELGRPDPLIEFRAKVAASGESLTLRETDLEILMIQFDYRRFNHLYFGTPFETYRARIRRDLGREPNTDYYIFGSEDAPCLDLYSGEGVNGNALNAGKKTHQLLNLLLRDFYAPMRLGTLFAELFPGEYFDVDSSPGRIHQVLLRARQYLKENYIPVVLRERDGFYSLEMTEPFSFRVPLNRAARSTNELAIANLEKHFAGAPFDASEGRAVLALSPSGFKKLMLWALDAGAIERTGKNRQTRYQLPSRHTKKAA